MNKIKVLHIYKTSLPQSKGGVEVFTDTLCNTTSDYGVENTLLSLAEKPFSTFISVGKYKVYQAKQDLFIASTGFSISAFFLFKKLAAKADIIHYHFPNPFADLLHFACRTKKPGIITYHSDIIKQKNLIKIYRPLMNRFLSSVDHIVSTSPNYFVTSDVLQNYKDKVTVIPIGINVERYPKLDEKRVKYWKDRLSQPFFLFVGAMRYYKGLHIALDAIMGTNIQLAIGGIGGIELELRQHAKRNKQDNVYFLGFVSDEDKVALLHLCHSFVFPSHLRSEAFGISLLEAAAYGKPLISCEIGTGTSYVNIHNQTGLVVTPGSTDELRKAMLYLLKNPDKAAVFGRNAKVRSNKLFTAGKQARAYYRLYRQLLGNYSLPEKEFGVESRDLPLK